MPHQLKMVVAAFDDDVVAILARGKAPGTVASSVFMGGGTGVTAAIGVAIASDRSAAALSGLTTLVTLSAVAAALSAAGAPDAVGPTGIVPCATPATDVAPATVVASPT